MQCVKVQIGETFPTILGCFPGATVALLRPSNARADLVIDYPPVGGVGGEFDKDNFTLYNSQGRESFNYNTTYSYKEIPLLLAWLKQQNLQSPL